MFAPGATGEGAPEFATTRSTAAATVVFVVVELFAALGSLVPEDTVDVAAITVPSGVAALTFTVTMMLTAVPEATLGLLQFTLPVAPTAGVVQVHPAGAETAWNVVLAGVACWKVTAVAVAGPLLATLWT